MKEQIVSFETAKLLEEIDKEKLINKHVTYFYKDKDTLIRFDTIPIKKGVVTTPAPTQCQVQKWLRDKHGIFLTVNMNVHGYFGYMIVSLSSQASYVGKTIYSNVELVNFEDVLERGLQRALRLIQNK